jgi:hypothetical protein
MSSQTSKQALWSDESGTQIPFNRITNSEKQREKSATKILKSALSINKALKAFKAEIKQACEDCEAAFAKENNATRDETYKGNYTFFNFDRSIKVERSVNETIAYDEETIQLAKTIFMSFLKESIDSSKEWVRDMVLEAFETKSGKLDPKRINTLHRYESRINNEEYTKACNLAKQAERRPDSKIYYRVWVRDEERKYKTVELNFSMI